MSSRLDRLVGLVGLSVSLISLFAPKAWTNMSVLAARIGVGVGAALFGGSIIDFLFRSSRADKKIEEQSKIEDLRGLIRAQIMKSKDIHSEETFKDWKKETLLLIRDWVKPDIGFEGWEVRFENGRYHVFGEKYNPCVWISADTKTAIEKSLNPHLIVLDKILEEVSPGELLR